ncbi:hypothetical protein COV93_03870 [Candidatus Woesearchaeota archaeon CG11_big_fil_rev_8_21_14_0_20_43_8]|nr:MAG: hypothetical protein COV93_03870 [Candidatus Woesearchaeota archaeon CG11_big_fil_rev_8_21_14_0_20_43_8]
MIKQQIQPQTPVVQATQDTSASCIFCKIIKGEIPAKKVHEDDKVICILDLYPASKGHVIIIPKEHHMIMPQLSAELIGHMGLISKKISAAILKTTDAEGIDVFVANGQPAGQKAPHFLMHVIPRYKNDALNFTLPEVQMNPAELDGLFEQIMPLADRLRDGPRQETPSVQATVSPKVQPQPTQQQQQLTEEQLMQVLDANPQLKTLLMTQSGAVKAAISQNPQLQRIFAGHDINAISQKLNSKGPSGGGMDLDKISNMLDDRTPSPTRPEPVVQEKTPSAADRQSAQEYTTPYPQPSQTAQPKPMPQTNPVTKPDPIPNVQPTTQTIVQNTTPPIKPASINASALPPLPSPPAQISEETKPTVPMAKEPEQKATGPAQQPMNTSPPQAEEPKKEEKKKGVDLDKISELLGA